MIRAYQIAPGDRIAVRHREKSYTRTVEQVGEGYVVISLCGAARKVPEHQITSHIKVGV